MSIWYHLCSWVPLTLYITLIFNLFPNPKDSYGIKKIKLTHWVCSLSLSLMIYMFILIRMGKDRDKIGFFTMFIELKRYGVIEKKMALYFFAVPKFSTLICNKVKFNKSDYVYHSSFCLYC